MKVTLESGNPPEVGLRLDETTVGEVYVVVSDASAGLAWTGEAILRLSDGFYRFVCGTKARDDMSAQDMRVRPLRPGERVILERD